ncbi:MAG: AMP-binding protein, partial [Alphaproteobacteria bacterium]
MFTQLLIVTAKKIMKALSDFRQIVEEYPNSIAVVDAGVSLSFSEFDTVSDALACRLHEGRRENSNIVGYLGWVSATCIVANMAVLKAGQCIVALDAENPPAVLRELIAHADLSCLVVAPGYETLAAQVFDGPTIQVDFEQRDRAAIAVFAAIETVPTAPATITYTSGSTGKPKGAVNSRQGLNNRRTRAVLASDLKQSDVIPSINPCRFPEQLAALSTGVRQECFDFRTDGRADRGRQRPALGV